MKRLLIFFIILLIVAFNFLPSRQNLKILANEQSGYARILFENTVFYANPDCTIEKFILPFGYFVKILQVGANSTRVSYMDSNSNLPESVGYIKTCDLFFSEQIPKNPYLNLQITVKSDEILFADNAKNYPKTVLSEGDTAFYYGELNIDGDIFCYVYSAGFIGYVRKNAFISFVIPEHELPLPKTETSETESSEVLQNSSLNEQTATKTADETLKTVIIVAVCIVCLSIVYLIFKPNGQAFKPATTKDDDDYF